jgi:hypothetical protein
MLNRVQNRRVNHAGSPEGKWRSFFKAPNLDQYVNTGVHSGRINTEGKVFRERDFCSRAPAGQGVGRTKIDDK